MTNIFDNYKRYVDGNAILFESVDGLKNIVIDDAEFRAFKETLLEGLSADERAFAEEMVDRQREVILEAADTALSGPDAIAFSVASLPMVTMVYSTPTLSNDGTVIYNVKTPTASIPVLEWVAKIIDIDGTTQEIKFPTAMQSVRPGVKLITKDAQYFNIFSELSITKDEFRISKKGLMVTGLKVTETDNGGNTIEHDVTVYAAADARGHFSADFEITAADGATVVFRVSGTANSTSGDVNWANVVIDNGGTTSTFETDSVTIKVRVYGTGSGKGTVKVTPLNSVKDVNVDAEFKFEITNISEVIQDWKSLYNVDILQQMTEMVKLQIELNRDYDIADLLRAQESVAADNGLTAELDFANLPSVYYENPRAVLSSIVPKIMVVRERIFRLTRRWADIIATGTDMAALLKSIQDFAINLGDKAGEFGLVGGVAEFCKLKIIGSNAIDNDTLYMWKKGTSASDATILTTIYKALTITTETTYSQQRVYVYSRYDVSILRENSIGMIKIKNYEGFLG